MRDKIGDSWNEFHPKTNVFWLHYLIDKLINEVPYKSKKATNHKKAMAKLRKMEKEILSFSSAEEIVAHYAE